MQSFDHFYEELLNPATLPGALFYGVVIAGAAWLAGRAVHLAIHQYLDRAEAEGADPTGIRFLGQIWATSASLYHCVPLFTPMWFHHCRSWERRGWLALESSRSSWDLRRKAPSATWLRESPRCFTDPSQNRRPCPGRRALRNGDWHRREH